MDKFTKEEIEAAKTSRDFIVNSGIKELQSIYMAGEICMYEELKEKKYSLDQIKELLETLRIKLGIFSLYDRSYIDKWIKEYLK